MQNSGDPGLRTEIVAMLEHILSERPTNLKSNRYSWSILPRMADGNEAQLVLEFALQHKIFFAPVAGTIVAFGFAAGRYFFAKQLAILKQENELLDERVKKALAELDEKTRALLAKTDPIQAVRIEERKTASDRNAASRFFRTTANLLGLLLLTGCLYWLSLLSTKQNQQFTQEQEDRKELRMEIQKIQELVKQKPASGPASAKTKQPLKLN
jgi:hypothetical protein